MSKNVLIIYSELDGLHCECGNGEVRTGDGLTYKTFRYFWTDRGAKGKALGCCLKCNSDLQEPEHRVAPADKKADLLATFGQPAQ
ncbi:hypothetical protein SOM61_22405 [Massilia sp. CFBP9012]|uniref:hypothetical protein n=1 Tax=Massilia sp. CFBP9012 TaxID=3096531 RepID=UPI002A69E1EC|nr:hypothetical protein [Massilia sp. CFBP9012]MDY0977718.1 hypothetical protein [Massilia sp. CFBP9012]